MMKQRINSYTHLQKEVIRAKVYSYLKSIDFAEKHLWRTKEIPKSYSLLRKGLRSLLKELYGISSPPELMLMKDKVDSLQNILSEGPIPLKERAKHNFDLLE